MEGLNEVLFRVLEDEHNGRSVDYFLVFRNFSFLFDKIDYSASKSVARRWASDNCREGKVSRWIWLRKMLAIHLTARQVVYTKSQSPRVGLGGERERGRDFRCIFILVDKSEIKVVQ